MNELQLKLCDIQGRLFELSAEKNYDSAAFIKAFMMPDTAKEMGGFYYGLYFFQSVQGVPFSHISKTTDL